MTRLEAIQYLFDHADPETDMQRLAMLAAIQDIMYATDGAFDMLPHEVEKWLDDSLSLVRRGEHGF